MLPLRHTVAGSAPLVGAYSGFPNDKRKIEKPRPGEIFLTFFRFQRDLGQHLGVVISNIQTSLLWLTKFIVKTRVRQKKGAFSN
jgi:hypothetical protein